MKCPDCGKRLLSIRSSEEWICDNPLCNANLKNRLQGCNTYAEYYGSKQETINRQKYVKELK